MKILLVFGLLIVLCLPAFGAGVPNLVGNWTRTDVEGIVYGTTLDYSNVDTPGNFTWYYENTTPGIPMIVIKEQRDRAFTGTWMTFPGNKSTYETLIGMIGYDNSSIYMLHGGDREIEGKLESSSEMTFVKSEGDKKEGMMLMNQRFSKVK